MRARCAGAHPPGVAWPQRQKSGGVATVMRVGNCDEERDSSTPAEKRRRDGDDAEAQVRWCGGTPCGCGYSGRDCGERASGTNAVADAAQQMLRVALPAEEAKWRERQESALPARV